MFGNILPRKKRRSFYSLGQEIKVNKNSSFNYGFEKDHVYMCKNRIFFAMSLFILAFFVITIRLFDICVVPNINKNASGEIIEKNGFFAHRPIKRADIVDRNGAIIATSLPTVNLFVNPKKVISPEESAYRLSEVLTEFNEKELLEKLRRKATFVYIKRNLTPSQQKQINDLGIPGLDFENGEKRVYPHESLFSHIIGKTNIDNIGLSGVERELDDRLTQSDIPLHLTIDAAVQYTIREELMAGIKKYDAEGGVAVLMDVNTSEIVAMVSLPDFDPNAGTLPNDKAMFNFATQGVYEPGSVFKVFNTSLGLDSGKIKVTDKFDATKPLKISYNTISDYRGENRWLSVPEILIYSSNIGSAQIALKLGKDEQRKFLDKVGLLSPLNIEIAEKANPIVPKVWRESTIATVSYGYGISVTPLHVITSFSAMVNGGIYNPPKLVKGAEKSGSKRVVSEKTSKTMRKLLREVVVEGSGKRANVLGYEVAGKTGTANKLVNGKYINKKVMTTFVATFPASNPKYALYVMLDEPKGSKETWDFVTSGWNTVPTASNIISAIAPQLNVKANYDIDELRKSRIIEASY
ncbi:MAG: penicillin-binding protein 2 [Lactobacillaceae bacterium]|jgi:cell division protein FtsI (penicillin-binding protein 3)|nr:penicillin-binding protein 2 [Lactobacillaceae bacterium]